MDFLASLKSLFAGKKGGRVDVAKRFELRGKTGQGSMSKVFQAYDRNIGRVICLKVLDKEKTAKFEARFPGLDRPTEGEICSILRHDHIVTTYDYGVTTKGEQFLVMEWVEGHGLNFLVETRNKVLAANCLNYLVQLADAVDYLHGQRYLHRDLCPRNVMVTNDGQVKLIDFGLTVPWAMEFCRPGNRTGTTDYLAPEIIKRQSTDNRVDLFALGVTAYEMFTGDLPWERGGDTTEKLRRHMNLAARDPRDLKPDLSEPIVKLLLKSVERDPAKRFQTASAFRDACKALLQPKRG